jgi:hypothetical protein
MANKMNDRKAMETKADIINKIATLQKRVSDLETAMKNGRKLTPFGEWLYNDDKKDIINLTKILERQTK